MINDINFFITQWFSSIPDLYFLGFCLVLLVYSLIVWPGLNTMQQQVDFLTKLWYSAIGLLSFLLLLNFGLFVQTHHDYDGVPTQIEKLNFIVRSMVLWFCIISMLVGKEYVLRNVMYGASYIIVFLFSIWSVLILIRVDNLVSIFLCISLTRLCTGLLVCNYKYTLQENKTALIFLLYNIIGSLIFLYGVSIMYGFAGSVKFSDIEAFFNTYDAHNNSLLSLGIIMIVVGMCFQVVLAPFNMWFINVRQNCNYFSIMFALTVSRFVTCYVFLKLLWGPLAKTDEVWSLILQIILLLSVVSGFVNALFQRGISRVMGDLCMTQVAIALMVVFTKPYNVTAQVAFMLSFVVMMSCMVGIYGILMWASSYYKNMSTLEDLKNLAHIKPFYAFVFCMFILALCGLPPLGGFFSKVYIVNSLLASSYSYLGPLLIAFSVVAAFVYLKVNRYVFIKDSYNNSEVYLRSSPHLLMFNSSLGLLVGTVAFFAVIFTARALTLLHFSL